MSGGVDKLRMVGFWSLGGLRPYYPHPRLLASPEWERHRLSKIADYLRSGVSVAEYLGYSHCRFPDGPSGAEMGCRELSDGVWVWPEGLSIYVNEYSVRLPDEFVEHMAKNGFEIPVGLDSRSLSCLEYEAEYWRRWCRENIPPWWSLSGLKLRMRPMPSRTKMGRSD